MYLSCLDLYTIGIGPSSSHTVGPMRAACQFAGKCIETGNIDRIKVELFGSLAHTGKGHGTDKALLAGLHGMMPESVDPEFVASTLHLLEGNQSIQLMGKISIPFEPKQDLVFNRRELLPQHSNGMRFTAFDKDGESVLESIYYSIGGGFIIQEGENAEEAAQHITPVPYPFKTATELLAHCEAKALKISAIIRANEICWHEEDYLDQRLDKIWDAMKSCIRTGCKTEGVLPGGLKVGRRAPGLYKKLKTHSDAKTEDHFAAMDWVNLYALAVNEENAAGGKVVTAPTNGAAGIIPAVMYYYDRYFSNKDENWHRNFLMTSAAVGMLFKKNASISGADVGCQGEVGVACSMAAAGLAEVLGGNVNEVENAAEIGMEHNLGLTCDPVGGLVQIPCIERNAMASVKAINAARLALRGEGKHSVSLDAVIKTMRDTGRDMRKKYKETSRGGLAVNVTVC